MFINTLLPIIISDCMTNQDFSFGSISRQVPSPDRYFSSRQNTEPLKNIHRARLMISLDKTQGGKSHSNIKPKFLINRTKKLPANFFGDLSLKEQPKIIQTERSKMVDDDSDTPHFMDQNQDFLFKRNLSRHVSHQSTEASGKMKTQEKCLKNRLFSEEKMPTHMRSVESSKPSDSSPERQSLQRSCLVDFDAKLSSLLKSKLKSDFNMAFIKRNKPQQLPPLKLVFRKKNPQK